MARQSHGNNQGSCIVFFIAFLQVWSCRLGYGSSISDYKNTQIDDGDTIDCIDIYKQPALNHPLLKNHIIQMKPSSFPSGLEARNSTNSFRSWFKNIKCPKGTIPISRTQAFTHRRVVPPTPKRKKFTDITLQFIPPPSHEYAQVSVYGDNYYGARGIFNVWEPKVNSPGEFSIAQMWVLSGDGDNTNSVEAGWQVQYGSNKTTFFIFWTRDGYRSTGCYNLECPGFVQVSKRFAPGASIKPLSMYDGKQFAIEVIIHKDTTSGNWWLTLQDEHMGYWPGNILTSLANSSDVINFGGEIVNNQAEGHHTTTEMGSGHFPDEGFGKAAYISYLSYIDTSCVLRDAGNLTPYISRPTCYDLKVDNKNQSTKGVHVYFGGPGFSGQCQ
ncbi:hypothetical protein K2173_024499 [Erythroxylum novogranatense]|uniref:Neprosin PEP catalytic domain-containing protein n=1 Tax=Erythroxylum novogranatense TaxID=1862640 RepID=A0AAV8SVR8_9ROSI|nr:hypothetical protein K2173_024499 [Erythroxylum novogranatense]